MNRRGFLGAILAAAVAPAVVRADALMRVVPRDTTVWMGVDLAESVSVTEVQLLRGEIGRWEGVRIIPHSRSCIAEAKVLQDIVNRQLSEYIRATAASPFARAAVLSTSDPYVGVAV